MLLVSSLSSTPSISVSNDYATIIPKTTLGIPISHGTRSETPSTHPRTLHIHIPPPGQNTTTRDPLFGSHTSVNTLSPPAQHNDASLMLLVHPQLTVTLPPAAHSIKRNVQVTSKTINIGLIHLTIGENKHIPQHTDSIAIFLSALLCQ